jgi:O-antigen ligase
LAVGKHPVHGPGLALLGILIITSTIGFEHRLPVLSLGINLQIPDILLLGLLGWVAVQWLFVPGFRLVRTRLDLPMLIFYTVTLLSTLIAIVESSVDVNLAIQGFRVFSYYLTFFVVTNLVRDSRQLNSLLNGILLLGVVVAVTMIAQYLLGGSVQLLQGSADPLTEGGAFGGVRRIIPPGFSVLLVSFGTSLCILVLEKFNRAGVLRYPQCALMGIAFVMTFLRSFWAAFIVVLLLAAYFVRGVDWRRLIGWGVMAGFSLVLVLLVVFAAPDSGLSRLVEASWARLSTVNAGAFTGGDANYNYRRLENQYAFSAIAAKPLLGRGLGATYRPLDPRLDVLDGQHIEDHSDFIHNSHLKILVQSGLLGYASFIWLSVAFLLRGLRNWRKVPSDQMRAVVLGFCLVYLVALIAAGANSVFTQWAWVPVLGIMMGMNEVILREVRPA